jgi:hypothetical protein
MAFVGSSVLQEHVALLLFVMQHISLILSVLAAARERLGDTPRKLRTHSVQGDGLAVPHAFGTVSFLQTSNATNHSHCASRTCLLDNIHFSALIYRELLQSSRASSAGSVRPLVLQAIS